MSEPWVLWSNDNWYAGLYINPWKFQGDVSTLQFISFTTFSGFSFCMFFLNFLKSNHDVLSDISKLQKWGLQGTWNNRRAMWTVNGHVWRLWASCKEHSLCIICYHFDRQDFVSFEGRWFWNFDLGYSGTGLNNLHPFKR